MANTSTKTKVINFTRTELMQGTAKRFLDIASDNSANCEFYYDRLEEMMQLQLVTDFELVVSSGDEAIGGVSLCFDWDKHTAMVRKNGEFVDPNIINQYGTADSITDTLEVVRKYVSGLFEHHDQPRVNVWYTRNDQKFRELGEDRFNQLLGCKPKSAEQAQETRERWAKIVSSRAEKAKRRVSTIGDLPETSIKAW